MARHKRNDATFCRLKGWTVGTVLSIEIDMIRTERFWVRTLINERVVGAAQNASASA